MVDLVFTVGMWAHVYANAELSYHPVPAPYEWWGELRLVFVVWLTLAFWVCFWVLTPYNGGPHAMFGA